MYVVKFGSGCNLNGALFASYLFLFLLVFYFVFPGYYKIYAYLLSLVGIFSVIYFRDVVNFKPFFTILSIFVFVSLSDIYNYISGSTNLSDFEKIIRNVVLIFPFLFFAYVSPVKSKHLLLAGTLMLIVTLIFLILQHKGLYAQNAPHYNKLYPGLWFNKGSFSSAVIFFYAFFSGVSLSINSAYSRVLFVVSFLSVSVILFLTQARGPFLAFGFVNFVICAIWINSLALSKKTKFMFLMSLFLVACLVSYSVLGDRLIRAYDEISTYLVEGSKPTSVGIRIDTWKLAWDVFLESPLWGVGAQGDSAIKISLIEEEKYPRYLLKYHTHSEYFMTLERGGIIGLLGLIWMIIFPIISLKRSGVRIDQMYPLLFVVLAFSVIGITSATIRNNIGANSFIFCLLASYFFSYKYFSRDLK